MALAHRAKESPESSSAFVLPPLPFATSALEPHMSAHTLEFHHGKHHLAYVNKAKELVQGTELEGKSVDEVVKAAHKSGDQVLFNNAGQHWNHCFFWNSLAPKGGGQPGGRLGKLMQESFGGWDGLRKAFADAAATNFGSGWTWLLLKDGKLAVRNTSNADLPLVHGETALLTLDVWEHAYYLDFQNRRPDFIGTFLDRLANWDFAEENLGKA